MYYNQNNYANIAYPAPGYENATVKSSGCGPCCVSMIVEGLSGSSFPPEKSARLAISTGARVSGGTDMQKLSSAVAKEFNLELSTSSKLDELIRHLASGGWAAANVGGDRSGYTGLFSNGGHYVTVCANEPDGRLVVWDPGYYSGKFNIAGRKGRVEHRGNDVLTPPDELDSDCLSRSPRYYLLARKACDGEVEKVDDTPSVWAEQAWALAKAQGVLDGTSPKSPLTREQLALVLMRLGLLK